MLLSKKKMSVEMLFFFLFPRQVVVRMISDENSFSPESKLEIAARQKNSVSHFKYFADPCLQG